LSSKRFALLYDFDFTESFFNFGFPEYLKHLHPKNINETVGERMYLFLWAIYMAKLIGLLISFILSLIIILKRKSFWMNALIVLILALTINKLGVLDSLFIKSVTNAFGNLFISYSLKYSIIINGIYLTVLGLLLFFNKWIGNFIFRKRIRPSTD
jgi:hypothetical protein